MKSEGQTVGEALAGVKIPAPTAPPPPPSVKSVEVWFHGKRYPVRELRTSTVGPGMVQGPSGSSVAFTSNGIEVEILCSCRGMPTTPPTVSDVIQVKGSPLLPGKGEVQIVDTETIFKSGFTEMKLRGLLR